ncbi:MAG: acyl-CoA thioesterase [Nanoarchaeota archaeon]|nr:acyl-CoA thioesterase [Nanoarchaeota archaeon]MBU0978157.1 acyl-CoA thioesterase [Nanoarchaeota archaeon]
MKESRHFYVVRQEHLDGNGHGNNTRCQGVFFEASREKVLACNGLGADVLREGGVALYVSRHLGGNFFRPIYLNDIVSVYTTFEYAGGVRVTSEQRMVRRGEKVADARMEYVFVNVKTGRPIRPPADLVEKLGI